MASIEDAIRLIVSFLGGGLVAALIASLNARQVERKRQRIDFVRAQLQELYGPLQFFTSCNAQLFKLTDDLNTAYTAEYVNVQFSEQYNAQERASQRALQTIDLSNKYVRQVVENDARILEILTKHYSLIDPDDAEVFAQFIVHYTRYKTEIDESGRLRTPLEVYHHLGKISFMRPEFIEAVDSRFKRKQAELKRLMR